MEPSSIKKLHHRGASTSHSEETSDLDEHYLSRYIGRDDEISLIDLWLILYKRKHVIAAIILCAGIAGIAWAWLSPATFEYATTVEIGTTVKDMESGELQPVEAPDGLVAKLRHGYIPRALSKHAEQHQQGPNRYKVDVSVPAKSDIVILKSTGSEQLLPTYNTIHQSIVDSVRQDHDRILDSKRRQLKAEIEQTNIELQKLKNPASLAEGQGELEAKLEDMKSKLAELEDPRIKAVPRKELELQLEEARNQLAQFKDKQKLLEAKRRRLADTDELLKGQIADLEAHLDSSQRRNAQAIQGINDEAQAMTLMMLDSEQQNNRNLLSELKERRQVELAAQRDELSLEIDDVRRAQTAQAHKVAEIEARLENLDADNEQQQQYYREQIRVLQKELNNLQVEQQAKVAAKRQEISSLETQLDNLRTTRAIATPEQTAAAQGPGNALIVVLAVVVGTLIAVFAAFLMEFMSKARDTMRLREQSE